MHRAIAGVLIGTAVGDSIGLPMEGLSRKRQERIFPPPLRQRIMGRWGMTSDDTEHTIMLAQALLEFPNDAAMLQRCFSWKLRWWLAGLPAGIGFATARAIVKLWFGVPPHRSGVYSAGNGPAMRSALLGIYFSDDHDRLKDFVRASTRITHTDPRAEVAALAIAETAAWMAAGKVELGALQSILDELSEDMEWQSLMSKMRLALAGKESVSSFAKTIGATDGVSGYAYQTVPVAIYSAFRHQGDFRAAIGEAIACGGDTDTVGAITGALVGARVGVDGIPQAWRNDIAEWPRSLALMERIAEKLARQHEAGSALGPVSYFWPAIPFRNILFLVIVLAHGFRRLLPPY